MSDSIVKDHELTESFSQFSMDKSKQLKGVPGTEITICNSENHYFDQVLVTEDQCHIHMFIQKLREHGIDWDEILDL